MSVPSCTVYHHSVFPPKIQGKLPKTYDQNMTIIRQVFVQRVPCDPSKFTAQRDGWDGRLQITPSCEHIFPLEMLGDLSQNPMMIKEPVLAPCPSKLYHATHQNSPRDEMNRVMVSKSPDNAISTFSAPRNSKMYHS